MTRLLALLTVIGLAFGCEVARLWYLFGLWPVAWWPYLVFVPASLVIQNMATTVVRGDK